MAAAAGALTIAASSLLYHTSTEGPLVITSHWVSHLGTTQRSGILFTVGLIITGALAIPFIVSLFRTDMALTKNSERVGRAGLCFGLASITGLWIAGIWDMRDFGGIPHAVGSALFFFCSLVMVSLVGRPKAGTEDARWICCKYLKIKVIAVFVVFLLAFVPTLRDQGRLRTLLTSTDPIAHPARFMEWMVFAVLILWYVCMGVVMKHHSRASTTRPRE
jgi:hypothetical membrane protein